MRSATTMRTQGIQGTSRRGEEGENINMGTQERRDDVPESQEGCKAFKGGLQSRRHEIGQVHNFNKHWMQSQMKA